MSDNKTVFSDVELEAMRARAKEAKAEEKNAKNRALGESDVQDAIAKMSESEQVMAKKIHEIVAKTAPDLWPKTWYGMPAYATKEGKVVCFFQPGSKFKYRYSTLGFQEDAKLDEGNMWASSFALIKLDASEEAEIAKLVKKAIS